MKLKQYLLEGFADNKDFTSDAEMIRVAIAAEIDAINFYEQMAAKIKDPKAKKILLDVAQEEKVHVGEFEAILAMLDPEHEPSRIEGKEEVENEF